MDLKSADGSVNWLAQYYWLLLHENQGSSPTTTPDLTSAETPLIQIAQNFTTSDGSLGFQQQLANSVAEGSLAIDLLSTLFVNPSGGLGAGPTVASGGRELLLDTNAVISNGRTFLGAGESVVKAGVSDIELANLVGKGRISMPSAADKISSVANSLNVDLRINVRALLNQGAVGNFADGIIGATAIERGSILVTNDFRLLNAVNKLGGSAIRP